MIDPTAEAINWALERAALLAEEAAGAALATAIRQLKVEPVNICIGSPEELEEMDTIARFRAEILSANLRAVETVMDRAPLALRAELVRADYGVDDVTIEPLEPWFLTKEIAAVEEAKAAIDQATHLHDRNGPMLPVDGVYRVSCSCGHVETD